MKHRVALSACLVAMLWSGSAAAETHVFRIVGPVPFSTFQIANVGAELTGISRVDIRVVGTGGSGQFFCTPQDASGWYDMDIRVCLGNHCVIVSAANGVAFDERAEAIDESGGADVCENTPTCPLAVSGRAHGMPATACSLGSAVWPEVSLIEVTITADSVVDRDGDTWGALKAVYR